MVDRYTRLVLTVIAVCLVYLCLLLSRAGVPLAAQGVPQVAQGQPRPGMSTGPVEVVIVGWQNMEPMPVAVRGPVTTQPSADALTRVVLAGWEDYRRVGTVRLGLESGLPIDFAGQQRPPRVVL